MLDGGPVMPGVVRVRRDILLQHPQVELQVPLREIPIERSAVNLEGPCAMLRQPHEPSLKRASRAQRPYVVKFHDNFALAQTFLTGKEDGLMNPPQILNLHPRRLPKPCHS